MNDCTLDDEQFSYYINLDFLEDIDTIELGSLAITSTNLKNRQLIEMQIYTNIEMSGIIFEDVQINTDRDLIQLGIPESVIISDSSFEGVYRTEYDDTINYIFGMTGLNVSGDSFFELDEISISDCTLSIFYIPALIDEPTSDVKIQLSNFYIGDTVFEEYADLIVFEFFSESEDITLELHNITINSIDFEKNGVYIDFRHQIPNQAVIDGLYLTSCYNGFIKLNPPFISELDLPTSLEVTDVVSDDVGARDKTFFMLDQNTYLWIHDTDLAGFFGFAEGSVVAVDTQYSTVQIDD